MVKKILVCLLMGLFLAPVYTWAQDGLADLAVYRQVTGGQMWVYQNNGASSFGFAGQWVGGVIAEPNDIPVVGDFNGDGLSDFLITRSGSTDMAFLFTSTGSGLAWGGQIVNGALWEDNDILLAGDFNNDGFADLVIARRESPGSQRRWRVWIFFYNGSYFFDVQMRSFVLGGGTSNLDDIPLAADFNGDGYADLAAYVPSRGGEVWIGLNNGPSLGFDDVDIWVGGGIMEPTDLILGGDFTGDKLADLAVYRPRTGGQVWMWRNNGARSFDYARRWVGGAIMEPTDLLLAGDFTPLHNTPPVASCKDVTVTAGLNCTADAFIDNGSYDPDSDTITIVQSPAGPYSVGSTVVTLTVTDSNDASSSCQATVTVKDVTPPTITSFSVSPSIVWPPNHEMVTITPTLIASDNCGASVTYSVVSNEAVNGLGDGNTVPDWTVDGSNIQIRAERSGKGSDRIYTITATVTDSSGNSSTADATVTVPHDSRK